jgi:DNA-binding NtrC family response regulator
MDLYYRVAVTSLRIPPLRSRPEDIDALAGHYLRIFADERRAGPRTLSPEALAALQAYPWPGNVRELRNVMEAVGLVSMEDVVAWADLPEEIRTAPTPAGAHAGGTPPASGGDLRGAEAEAIRVAMRLEGGNLTGAARRLGIAKSTLYAKIRSLGLGGDLTEVRGDRVSGSSGGRSRSS